MYRKSITKLMAFALFLILVAAVASGCDKKDEVKEKLIGTWCYTITSINGPCSQIYTFYTDGTYEMTWENTNASFKSSSGRGTYAIEDSRIVLTGEDGKVDSIIEYSLEDEVLSLVDKNSDGSGNHLLTNIS